MATQCGKGDDFLVLPSTTSLMELDTGTITAAIRYIIVKQGNRIASVLPAAHLFRFLLLHEGGGSSTLGDIEGGLSFLSISDRESLLDIQCPSPDIVLLLSSSGDVSEVIDSVCAGKQLMLYKTIFDNFVEEIFVTDSDGRILLVNPKGEQIMGMKASDMEGRLVEELVEQQIFSISGAREVLKQKKKIHVMQQVKEGQRWRLCSGVPALDKEGKIVLTICTSKDMTELVDLRRVLESKEDELKRKDNELCHMQEELFAQVNLISASPQMRQVKEAVQKIAPLNLTVLLQGETGVGKDVVARAIHALSPRREFPFMKINCATLSDTLIESELFGYEGGSFTGADSKGRKGKIEIADRGTLFLDEIGEISNDIQVKLLEFLEDKKIFRIGGTRKIKVNTRIIAATNRVLEEEVDEGRFRKDLFYRLSLFPIMIPPLRNRKEDISALVAHYIEVYNRKYNKNVTFGGQVIEELTDHEWPGNVRELQHMIERAIVISNDGRINSMSNILKGVSLKEDGLFFAEIIPYREAKRELERQLVGKAYEIYGSTYKAAEALEVDQSTVSRILKRIKETDEQ